MTFQTSSNINSQINFKIGEQGEILFAGLPPVITYLGFDDGVDVGSFLYDDGDTAGKLISQE
jgi:hypothetical protein